MHELLGAYGGDALVNNVFGLSPITRASLEDPYKRIDYLATAAVFDSILLNVDSLEALVRLNHKLQAVTPWGLIQVFAAQARSRTVLEFWARLESMARLMLDGWRSSIDHDGELVTISSDWTHHPGIGFVTVGACFMVHQIGSRFGVMPVHLQMPFQPGDSIRKRIETELPGVEIEFEAPYERFTYRRRDLLAAPLIPAMPGPRVTYQDLAKAYYPKRSRATIVRLLDAATAMIDEGLGLTLPSVATRAGVSQRALQRDLASGGFTMRSAVERIRVLKAEELLAETDRSILDIADTLGYASHQALTRVFKRWRGLSPKEYRRFVARNQPGAGRQHSLYENVDARHQVEC
jgi:AraC-like DNA-binding protein